MEKALVFLFLFQAAASIELKDYCKHEKRNTPCLFCTVNKRCGSFEPEYIPLTNAEKEAVLDVHNKLRDEVAAGKYVDKNLQQAADMEVMSWDKETEFITACYIKQCKWGHDEKRVNAAGVGLGQNLYMEQSSEFKRQVKHHLVRSVTLWFEEYVYLTPENTKHIYSHYGPIAAAGMTGHLTQVVWGNSKFLGCCYKHFMQGKQYVYFVFCNYLPPGNFQGRKIYSVGQPNCTKFNDKYPNLCGSIRPMSQDKFVVPYGAAVNVYRSSSLALALFCALFSLISF